MNIENTEQLQQAAQELALQHDVFMKRVSAKHLAKNIESDMNSLKYFVRQLHEQRLSCVQPAEEWLLDHAEFIESEVLAIKQELDPHLLRSLPNIKKTNRIRMYDVCYHYLEHTDGQFEVEPFMSYVRAYQEVSVLKLSEIWAMPLMMRIAALRKLTDLMDTIKERREVCKLVERILAHIPASELSPDRLKVALEDAGQHMPLSGPLTVHLIQHLREHADDMANVGEWLMCKLELGAESLDTIISVEYQLQAKFHISTGQLIACLRTLSRRNWRDVFEQLSIVESSLREEQAGDYSLMDYNSRQTIRMRIAKLAERLAVPEHLIASQAVMLANRAHEQEQQERGDRSDKPYSRSCYVGYYVLDSKGLAALHRALKMCGKTRPLPEMPILQRATSTYFNILASAFVVAMIAFLWWLGSQTKLGWLGWAAVTFAAALPISEWAVTALHWGIERVKKPVRLLRYDFSSGIPSDAATIIVIPVIWSTAAEVKHIVERLELHYLANRDEQLYFAILGDFKDANLEHVPEDTEVIATAKAEIDRLNKTYPDGSFHLFQRHRQWNEGEERWMGWERKRGKLVEFVELLKGSTATSFAPEFADVSKLKHLKYIITLDADTQLPLESAHRMVGAMHLSYNRPRLNEQGTRVIEGYGVLQPRMGITHTASQQSRFAALCSSDPGFDPYTFAACDPYQDGLGEGIFTGKGIFDIDAFHQTLCERIPENRVLSHDLLEGGFMRTGLLNDIELVDDHPASFNAQQKRLHRWVRGDWQLLLWLLPKVSNRRGELLPVGLSLLTRWQMIDNLRRSLLIPALMAICILAVTVLPGAQHIWFTLVLATLLLPVLKQVLNTYTLRYSPRSIFVALGHAGINLLTLPYQSIVLSHAICVTLYRITISKRRLLEWTSQAEVDRSSERLETPILLGLYGGYGLIIAFLLASIWQFNGVGLVMPIGLSVLWLLAPLVIRWMDGANEQQKLTFSAEEHAHLKKLAHEMWLFYEQFVTESDHWLPPDNVQIEPNNGIAHRTSPTNMGMYLNCALAARDFDFITTAELVERLEQTLQVIETLPKWEGHLYNWYDTETLIPLQPQFVSTVDSGNFVACLMTVKQGLLQWLEQEQASDMIERGHNVAAHLEQIIVNTDFRPLYDHASELFSLGYNVTQHKNEGVLYDLLASEARQASFVAIALGQVSVSHWNVLGRTMSKVGKGKHALLSWTGTMFEYMMPWLLMRTYDNTVWDHTYKAVVERQIEYAQQRGIPFGISESGYYAFDYQMNYQYMAFGVPGLGFKRGLEQDIVVAPYATIMALPFAKTASLAALKALEELGGRGRFGFYEALDFTQERMPEGRKHMVVRSFMAHHIGMSMLTLSNVLLPDTMVDRFHNDKRVRAAELLLQERMPKRPALIEHHALHRVHEPYSRTDQLPSEHRTFTTPHTEVPEVCVLSNGSFTSLITNSGSGFSRYQGLNVSRWREDAVRDSWGNYLYIRDVTEDKLWSPSYQPCRVESPQQSIQFALDRAQFSRVDGEVQTTMELCVSPEWDAEIRRITLKNNSTKAKVLEVTTFVELALAHPIADDAHPAFSKLFIRTDFDVDASCLVAGRRAREASDRTLWGAHSLFIAEQSGGLLEYDTDRSAFIGRGLSLAEPQAIRTSLSGKLGSVADPAFIMRRRINVEPGGQTQLFAVTAVAHSRDAAIDIVQKFQKEQAVDRTYQLAWNRVNIELRHLNLTPAEAMTFQKLIGHIMYTSPLRKKRTEHIHSNTKGQSSLWAYGVSGDRPAALVHVDRHSQLPFIAKLLTGHEYLRRLGLLFDLVILNESKDAYYKNLQELLQRAVDFGIDRFGESAAGIYVIPTNRLEQDDLHLLASFARMELQAGGPSMKVQMRLPDTVKLPPWLEGESTPELSGWTTPIGVHEHMAYSDDIEHGLEHKLAQQYEPEKWLFYNGIGGFSNDGKQYNIIVEQGKYLPAPWINVLANPRFGTIVSELGTGYSWWRNSRECKITPWSNDTVLDPPGEIGFIRDESSGLSWSLTSPKGSGRHANERPSQSHASEYDAPAYVVKHGHGFTSFEHERHDIKHVLNMFVPLEDPVKIMRVKLRNDGIEQRELSLTYYAEWVLGVQRQTNAAYIMTEWDEEAQALIARNQFQETFREATAFLGMYVTEREASSTTSRSAVKGEGARVSWTADRHEFIGRNGTIEQPEAMKRVELSNRSGVFYESCGAVQCKLRLDPGEEREVIILLGCDASPQEAAALALKYQQPSQCDEAWREVALFWQNTLEQTVVSTPSRELDVLLNGWLLYQSIACRMWARTAFYQAGGAYGYRDQLQDALAVLNTMPQLTRKQIILHAAHQYEEGDVQHWWHVETNRGIRTLFTDDLLWLPYVTARYVEHTGDVSVLQEEVSYITSEPLGEGEHERYEETVRSDQVGTIYEHCLRAIDKALSRIGEHGLPLIGVGDWNDGMNLVGAEGRGESVWLGWFLCVVLEQFTAYCMGHEQWDEQRDGQGHEQRQAYGQGSDLGHRHEHGQRSYELGQKSHGLAQDGTADRDSFGVESDAVHRSDFGMNHDGARVAELRERREQLIAALNEHGWDGQWYRRAFNDAGQWLGSIHNDECRIDAIAQSWSVISGGAPKDRALQAMQSLDRELVDRELKLIRLLTPPFDKSDPSPGYIQGYPPGIRENGAQYTHGVLWSIVAWSKLKNGDKAFEYFNMLNPINHTRSEQDIKRYVGEPYVMAADVYTAEPHKGHAGWTWYTGASSWMYQVGLEHILGIQRRGQRLYIVPCIPANWPGYDVTYRYGKTSYVIAVSRHEAENRGRTHGHDAGRGIGRDGDGRDRDRLRRGVEDDKVAYEGVDADGAVARIGGRAAVRNVLMHESISTMPAQAGVAVADRPEKLDDSQSTQLGQFQSSDETGAVQERVYEDETGYYIELRDDGKEHEVYIMI